MYRVLIVDDEAIVRSTLATVVDWEAEGFRIEGSALNGKLALEMFLRNRFDVVFTDIKMPIMGGMELIGHLSGIDDPPLIIVLSAYNDFPLVREAFRYGVHDYIMKSDINRMYLIGLLRSVKDKLSAKEHTPGTGLEITRTREERLCRMALGSMPTHDEMLQGIWRLACFEIDDFKAVSLRFGEDLGASLTQPMLALSAQIPRVSSDCVLTGVSPSRLVMLILGEESAHQAKSICKRVQKIWNDYLNITCTAGISPPGYSENDFPARLHTAYDNVTYRYLFGPGGAYSAEEDQSFNLSAAFRWADELQPLWSAVKGLNTDALVSAQQAIFAAMYRGSLRDARETALAIVYHTMLQLSDMGADPRFLVNSGDQANFYQKIMALENISDVERWIVNFVHWVTDYLEQIQVTGKIDIMEKAKRFIAENYADRRLTLAAVADHVGLSEKYFSSRFTKENKENFIDYLTNLRINKAKQLLLKTDMKIYMISDAVGFNSVEHFTRVFKKKVGVSPRHYSEES